MQIFFLVVVFVGITFILAQHSSVSQTINTGCATESELFLQPTSSPPPPPSTPTSESSRCLAKAASRKISKECLRERGTQQPHNYVNINENNFHIHTYINWCTFS